MCADRRDYYFRQKVTEAELDAGFDGLEQADFNLAVDNEFIGIVQGMGVSEKSGTPNLSVDVQGPGTAYSKDGERINFSSTQNVDVSQDDGGTPTTVGTPGNTKVVSVFIEFDRALSDARIDGNSLTVYFQRDESFDFSVVQGAEATIGSEVPPPLDAGKILLADIRIENGTTQILDAATVGIYDQIDTTTRREDAFKFTGGTVEVTAGTAHDALSSLITKLNLHVDDGDFEHSYAAGQNWHDTTTVSATTVTSAIDEIISDLASTVSKGGADKIGIGISTATFADSSTLAAGSIHDQIGSFISAIAGTGAGASGAHKLGSAAISDSPESLTGGSLAAQLSSLLGHINDRAELAGTNSWTNKQTFNNGIEVDNDPIKLLEVDSEANMLLPKILVEAADVAYERICLFHSNPDDNLNEFEFRIYLEGGSSDQGISFVINASWDGTNWVQTASGQKSYMLRFDGEFDANLEFLMKDSGASDWTDSAWDRTAFQAFYDALNTRMVSSLYNGQLKFTNAVTSSEGSNISHNVAPIANTLYAKNICKAWANVYIDGSGNISTIDSFNFNTPSNPGASEVIQFQFKTALDNDDYAVVPAHNQDTNHRYVARGLTGSGFFTDFILADTGADADHNAYGGLHRMSVIVFGKDS